MIKEAGTLNFVLYIRGGNFVFLFDLEIGFGNGKFDNSRRGTNYVNGAAKINCSPVRNRINRALFLIVGSAFTKENEISLIWFSIFPTRKRWIVCVIGLIRELVKTLFSFRNLPATRYKIVTKKKIAKTTKPFSG